MSRDTVRYLSIAGLLGLAILASAILLTRRPATLPPASSHIFVTDIDNWRQTDQWRFVETPHDFRLGPNLADLPLQIGDWRGQDIPQTNLEVFILLEPEQYIFRRYENSAGRTLWLSLIGSRKTKSFHPPQICYSTDGWQTALSAVPILLPEGDIYT
ncbi:MAG: exosortase-associated EpsI family protein, partial [Anaerolineae bacterium]